MCNPASSASKKRAESNVIRLFLKSRFGLQDAVRGEADNFVAADQLTGFVDTDVILADMESIGAGFDHDFRVIVDDEGNSKTPAERNEWQGDFGDFGDREVFGAELHDFHPALEHLGGDRNCVLGGDISEVKDAVESTAAEIEGHLRWCDSLQEQPPPQSVLALGFGIQSRRKMKAIAPRIIGGIKK